MIKMNMFDYEVEKLQMDGIDMLKALKDKCASACFFDPQYRGVLDEMKYGNEGKDRQIDRCKLPQMDENIIGNFIVEIGRVLKPSGMMFLWIDKFHLLNGFRDWFADTDIEVVDMIVWNKEVFGMGYRTRSQCEFLIICQKNPIKSKGVWSDHSIADIHNWKIKRKKHVHEKPYGLLYKLVKTCTKIDDLVVDPAAGSYNVGKVCMELNRRFKGCYLK